MRKRIIHRFWYCKDEWNFYKFHFHREYFLDNEVRTGITILGYSLYYRRFE